MAFVGLVKPKYEDITMERGFLTCYIGLSKYGWRFKKAQEWLDREIMRKMEPIMPRKTGNLINRTKEINETFAGSGIVKTYSALFANYGHRLYPGVNPKTGKPYHWTNPKTQPYWGQYVVRTYQHELKKGVEDIIGGKK